MEDENDQGGTEEEEGLLLLEGWMFGLLQFNAAAAEVIRVPPANDNDPDGAALP